MDLTTLRVASADGTTVAEFVPVAGMLCCSLEQDGNQLLDLGNGVEAYAERGSTMAIPLLYPWANRLETSSYEAAGKSVTFPDDRALTNADPNGLPIHGAIPGLMQWEPSVRADETTLSAHLIWGSPQLDQLYPFAHEAHVTVAAAPGALAISTTVRATGQDRVPISFGYHPYLRLPEGGRERWRVKLPELERLTLDSRSIPTGARETFLDTEFELADSSWDDGFVVSRESAHTRFEVTGPSGHGIALEFLEGYPFAQVFSPAGHDFICFEPMTAPTNALRSGDGLTVLEPGQEYRAAFRVSAW